MSLQNILGNMLSGLAGQMAQGQNKGETLGMEGLSEEFAGAFRQAVEQLSALKDQGVKPGENAVSQNEPGMASDEESLLSELQDLVAYFSQPEQQTDVDITGVKPLDADLQMDLTGADTNDSAEPVGEANSQNELRKDSPRGVMPEGTDAAGLTEMELPVQASPRAKAILAELMTVWSAQVPTAGTVPVADPADAGMALKDLTAAKLPPMPALPAMPDLPPEVRSMLEQKGFVFETGDPASELPDPALDTHALAATGKITEKETVNNPASSKTGEAAALPEEATLPPSSFSQTKDTPKPPVELTASSAAKPPEPARLSETGALQAAAAGADADKSNPAGLQKAVDNLKNILESAPEQAKPALREVLDKLQTRIDAPETTEFAREVSNETAVEAPVDPDSTLPNRTVVEAPVAMADPRISGTPSSPAVTALEGLPGEGPPALEPVLPTAATGPSGKESLNVKGMAGTSAVDQVVNAATFSVQNGRKEVTLQLNPHELGDVRVRLSSDSANQVSARLIAATAEAHELLSQQIDGLQKSLEAQGIRVERIQVVLAGEGAQNQAENQSRSDTSQSGTQQQAFQDLAQQHYRSGRQDAFASIPGGRSDAIADIAGLSEPDGVSPPGENRNDNGRVSLLI